MSDERTVPYYCPYCGGEELRPHDASPGTWRCRECLRSFALRRIVQPMTPPPRNPAPADPAPTPAFPANPTHAVPGNPTPAVHANPTHAVPANLVVTP